MKFTFAERSVEMPTTSPTTILKRETNKTKHTINHATRIFFFLKKKNTFALDFFFKWHRRREHHIAEEHGGLKDAWLWRRNANVEIGSPLLIELCREKSSSSSSSFIIIIIIIMIIHHSSFIIIVVNLQTNPWRETNGRTRNVVSTIDRFVDKASAAATTVLALSAALTRLRLAYSTYCN